MNEINLPSKLIVEVECIVVPLLDAHSLCECECGEKGNEKVEAPFYGSVEIKGFDALMRAKTNFNEIIDKNMLLYNDAGEWISNIES